MSQSEFSIREATAEDLPELARIEAAVHVSPWSDGGFRSELDKPYSHTLIMTDDETDSVIAGYIVFWLMQECHILNVAVDHSYRGQGMAQKLIRKAVDMALRQSLKAMTLDVRKSNAPAIQLYQKLGFTIHHVRKGFYSNGEDAYGMTLDLNSEKGLEF